MQYLHQLEGGQNFSPTDDMIAIPSLFSAQYHPCLTNTLESFQVFSSWDSGQLCTVKAEQEARYKDSI